MGDIKHLFEQLGVRGEERKPCGQYHSGKCGARGHTGSGHGWCARCSKCA